jgi:hypothetical protein
MKHLNCPLCETKLESKGFSLSATGAVNYFYCPNYKIEYHYNGAEERWYAHIALGDFPKKAWEEFLFTKEELQ